MDSLLSNFGNIAKYLKHPLVLMGFVFMLIFNMYDKVLDRGIIPTLPYGEAGVIMQLMLAYGFRLGVLFVILGFAWQFYKTHTDADIKKKLH